MAEQSPEKARHVQMMRHFQQIDLFLKSNSEKFYQEYDTHNATLEQVREQLKEQAMELQNMAGANKEMVREIRAVLEIDAADGVANRLNMLTISLANLANPLLFNGYIKKQLTMDDLTSFSLRKIPWEVDAVFFISNPLLIFDLINDFLKYRTQQTHFTYMYITNRVTRLLYRFTKFVLEYEDISKVIQLTFLDPKRFNPLAKTIKNVVQILCLEAKENLLDLNKPIFINDLRRLYIILVRTLLTLLTNKKPLHPILKELLMELNPILALDKDGLIEDGMYKEFLEYHITSPKLKDEFAEQYVILQEFDFKYTFEFLGYLHHTDRLIILKKQYQLSKSYVLGLFVKIREYYQKYGKKLFVNYKDIANTIREIADYDEVQNDPLVDKDLKEELFFNQALYLDEVPSSTQSDTDDLELEKFKKIPLKLSLEQAVVLKNLQNKKKEEVLESDVLELAELPFCFMIIENGRSHFSLFTLGEAVLPKISDKAYDGLIEYLLNTKQITPDEKSVIIEQLPKITELMHEKIKKKLDQYQVQMYDEQNRLKFNDFRQTLGHLKNTIQTFLPHYLFLKNYKQFILDTLAKIEQLLAKEQKVLVERLAPKWVHYFIDSERINNFSNSLKVSLIGNRYPQEVKLALEEPDIFKKTLLIIHQSKQKILDYERSLLKKVEPVPVSSTSGTSGISQQIKDKSVEFFLTPFLTKEAAFEELMKNPEVLDPLLLELARIPFRFVEYVFGKPRFIHFTLADTVIMSMDGKTRKFFIEFLEKTQQLTEEEFAILKKHMVRLLFFMQKLCQKMKKGQILQRAWVMNNQINFPEFSRGLMSLDHKIRKDIRPLIIFKDHMQIFLEAVSETERIIAREKNMAISDLFPHQITDALKDVTITPIVIRSLKESAFGRKHLGDLVITAKSIEMFCQHLSNQYQLNVRLFTYHEQYQKKK